MCHGLSCPHNCGVERQVKTSYLIIAIGVMVDVVRLTVYSKDLAADHQAIDWDLMVSLGLMTGII